VPLHDSALHTHAIDVDGKAATHYDRQAWDRVVFRPENGSCRMRLDFSVIREPLEFGAGEALQGPDVREPFDEFSISHRYTVSRYE
jgi:hypothetical protein